MINSLKKSFSLPSSLIQKLAMILMLSIVVSGCHRPDECIDADDFGFKKVKVSSRADDADIHGPEKAQIIPWSDFNLVLSGRPVAIMVKNWEYGADDNSSTQLSAWCPWYGSSNNEHSMAKMCERFPTCRFANGEMCTPGNDAKILNPPCIMKRGVGLYALLASPADGHPNRFLSTMKNPDGINFHVGAPHPAYSWYDTSGDGTIRPAGGFIYNYDGDDSIHSSRLNYVNGRMYFKILDNYYYDNGGQYRVVIKSGIKDPGNFDLMQYVTDLVKERLFGNNDPSAPSLERYGIVRGIYQSIITQSSFVHAIRGMLSLYVILMALGFVMGFIQLTNAEVIKRTIKIATITTLINPTISWDFFNQYLFIWFYEGTGFIVEILKDAAATGPGSGGIIAFLTSEEIFIKLSSVLFATKTGLIYIIIYLLMLAFVVLVVFEATVLYLSALCMMGLLICLAPIFIALSLFERTKSFFDNWLKQLTSYAIQGIIVSAGVLFMTMIIRNQIYNTLGFRTCLTEFLAVGGPVPPLLGWYTPRISSDANKPPLAMMPIPKDHFRTSNDNASVAALGFTFDNKQEGDYCSAYECIGLRYPDLPFLDPNNPYDMRQMRLLRSDDIVDWSGLYVIAICIYLMYHFNQTTTGLAAFLGGTSENAGSNAAAAKSATLGLTGGYTAGGLVSKAAGFIERKTGIREARNQVHDLMAEAKYKYIDKAYENSRTNAKKAEALSGDAHKSILKKVYAQTGINQSQALEFNNNLKNGDYNGALETALKDHGKLQDTQAQMHAQQILKTLAKGEIKDLHNNISQELFGAKKYSELSLDQKLQVTDILNDGSMRDMLNAKHKAESFQSKYADIDLQMSKDGMGPLAKKSSGIESYQNIKNELKAEAIAKAERAKAEAADWEQLKHDASGGMFGSKKAAAASAAREGVTNLNETLKDQLKRMLDEGISSSEKHDILHDDARKRTAYEKAIDAKEAKLASATKIELDSEVVKAGAQIEKAQYLADLRANGKAELADKYDKLIKTSLKDQLAQLLRDEQDPTILGDTSIQGMKDEQIKKMMDRIQEKGNNMMKDDIHSNIDHNGDEGVKAEVDKRKQYMEEAINGELDRINDIRKKEGMEEYTPPTVSRSGGVGSAPGSGTGGDAGGSAGEGASGGGKGSEDSADPGKKR